MADAVTSTGVATILANPSPDSSSPISIVLQIVQLEKKASGGRYMWVSSVLRAIVRNSCCGA